MHVRNMMWRLCDFNNFQHYAYNRLLSANITFYLIDREISATFSDINQNPPKIFNQLSQFTFYLSVRLSVIFMCQMFV